MLLAAGAFAVWSLRCSSVLIPVGCLAVSLAASVFVLDQQTTGGRSSAGRCAVDSAVPFRVVGLLDDDVAFAVGLLLARQRGYRRRDRVHRPARDRQPRGRHHGGGALRALAAGDPAARGEQASGRTVVERRRRAPPLHRAAFDRARRGGDRAPARAGALSGPARDGRGAARQRLVVRPSNGFFAAAAIVLLALRLGLRTTLPARGRRARVCAAPRRLLAEGVSDDPERPRLLAPIRPIGPGSTRCSSIRGRCSSAPARAGRHLRAPRGPRGCSAPRLPRTPSSTPSTSTRICIRASSMRPAGALRAAGRGRLVSDS